MGLPASRETRMIASRSMCLVVSALRDGPANVAGPCSGPKAGRGNLAGYRPQ
jgi:hypothetical protein